jgi:hypothetical protein
MHVAVVQYVFFLPDQSSSLVEKMTIKNGFENSEQSVEFFMVNSSGIQQSFFIAGFK